MTAAFHSLIFQICILVPDCVILHAVHPIARSQVSRGVVEAVPGGMVFEAATACFLVLAGKARSEAGIRFLTSAGCAGKRCKNQQETFFERRKG